MSTIKDLKNSISQMSTEDAIQLVMERRASRRIPKNPPKKLGKSSSSREAKKKLAVSEIDRDKQLLALMEAMLNNAQ